MESQFSAKSHSVSVHFEEEALLVRADPRKLRQVLFNILFNAIEYTEAEGSIGIEVRRTAEGAAYVEVSDTGIGIAEADLPRIFLNFSAMEIRPDRPSRGKGLGLALARRLILLHGGDIGVRSEHNVGSVFWFSLPVGEVAATQEAQP
jgi:signal transduction histidine kinase